MAQWKLLEIKIEDLGNKIMEMYRRGYSMVKILGERRDKVIVGFLKPKRVLKGE